MGPTSNTNFTYVGNHWYWVGLSFDVSVPTQQLYVNGMNDNPSGSAASGTIPYASYTDWRLGSIGGSQFISSNLADFYLDAVNFTDFSNPTNLAKFFNGGHPVNLGANGQNPTGLPPTMFMSGSLASWGTNKGNGGGFTVNGSLSSVPGPP